ncbi:MAG: leucine-rich repeat domain-containing protein, partial [Parabacteroides sp.]|nr:leucine-rich repeat domain-containing protein [Parabacteroides sp.]
MEFNIMKKTWSTNILLVITVGIIILLASYLSTGIAHAAEGSGNPEDIVKTREGIVNGTITFDKSTGTIISSSEGVIDIRIPNEIEGVEVKAIGSRAFSDRKLLNVVKLPETVERLGVNSFANCDNLREIKIPKSVTSTSSDIYNLFADLDNITKYVISAPPEEIEKIINLVIKEVEEYIESLEIVEGLEDVKEDKVKEYILETLNYYLCKNDISLPLKEINSLHDYITLVIEIDQDISDAADLASGPFSGCDNLSSVEFEDGMETIPAFILARCGGIEEVNFPDSITTIEAYAFSNCKNLSEVNLPNNIGKLGISSFENCDALKEIYIPTTLKETGGPSASPFKQCDGLKNITFEEGTENIPEYIFMGVGSIENVDIPEGITSIGNFAFYKCENLSKVDFPASLTKLGLECFGYCPKLEAVEFKGVLTKTGGINASPFEGSGLKNVIFPEKQTEIPQYMFTNCNNLTEIVIPEGITSIGNFAFYKCEN